jgi:peptide-methionine (S)-S-oxide reductase
MITYDPGVISRRQLFDVFFCIHDSTQLNRQGNDVGPQYRSIILYSDQEQREEALAVIEDYSDHYTDPIVTEVVPLERFWPAENYHIDYYSNNPKNPYCQMVVSPKLAKARAKFSHLYE